MPTYEYQCEKCRKTFDLYQSMKDDALATCPKEQCRMKKWGKGTVRRLLGTGAGLIFKGSGFYITDYRSEGYKASAKSDAGGGTSSGGESAAPTTEPKKAEPAKPAIAAAETAPKPVPKETPKKKTSSDG